MEEKIPPHDLDAEQSVLGSMILSKDAIALSGGSLRSEHFYRSAHAFIFESIIALYQKNEPVDLVTLSAELKRQNRLDDAGGRSYLAEVLDSVPTAANVEKYADILVDKYMLRRLIDVGADLMGKGFDDSQDVDELVESSQKLIMDVSKDRIKDHFVAIKDVLTHVFDEIQSVSDNDDKILGIPSGFPDLDAMTSGFQPADLIILAARPSVGKTTLALNFALHAAQAKKLPTAVFSLEMPKEQLALRLLSSEAKIDSKRLRTANMHEHEYKNLMVAMGHLSEAPLYIDDTPSISPLELRAKCRRLQMESDIKLILVDYLQLMRGSGRRGQESRFQEVSEIVRDVKGFAKESGIPIIALSQLSRAVEQRNDKRPQLSDLRESGELEQTADLVMFIHRDDYYTSADPDMASGPSSQYSPTEIMIAKHRNGPTGNVKLMFRKDLSRFLPAERSSVPVEA